MPKMSIPTIIAGPCVIEPNDVLDEVARHIAQINATLDTDIILKASFDKANRTSIHSYRGVGMEQGLKMLAEVKSRYGLRITTDIHEAWQAEPVSKVADRSDSCCGTPRKGGKHQKRADALGRGYAPCLHEGDRERRKGGVAYGAR